MRRLRRISIASEPGLGVELDEDIARKHPYTGSDLHLVMTEGPINP